MEKNRDNKDDFNVANKDKTLEYREAIREMIKSENEIRNQRTNWFLVIQGFLIAGICQLENKDLYFQFLIALVGMVAALSSWYAAWRSKLAVTFALSCWKYHLRKENKKKEDYAPISLITKEILEVDNSTGNNPSWEAEIQGLMYPDKGCKLCFHKILNQYDMILPYMAFPVLFLLFWIIYIIACFISSIILYLIPYLGVLLVLFLALMKILIVF